MNWIITVDDGNIGYVYTEAPDFTEAVRKAVAHAKATGTEVTAVERYYHVMPEEYRI